MKILATYNIKGGVGKTSAAVNLSYLAAADGLRVLLADLDPQAAATFLLRVRPRVKGGGTALIRGSGELDKAIKGTDFERLDLLPADFTFRNLDLILDDTKKPTRRLARRLGRPHVEKVVPVGVRFRELHFRQKASRCQPNRRTNGRGSALNVPTNSPL